jgi:pyruvate/2-oxoglutarate dehydrogenase complex dihydrolipoamide dehydrogenase (E3) component
MLSAVMAEILKTDLCIIGAGALGIALAIQARARDLGVVLVQRDGDTPVHTAQAALHRAAFCASAERAQAMRTAGALGLGKADPKLNFRAISERATAVADAAAPATSPERLAALGITLLSEPAVFADRRSLKVGSITIRAGQFVLATGSLARTPDLPGLDQVPYFTPDTILANMRKFTHLVVIGGDANALELAQAYARLGAAVTLVPHGPVLAGFDPELVAILLRALREEGVDILQGASVTAVLPRGQGTGIAIAHADGTQATLDVSHILVAAGRQPDLDQAMLEAARLKRDRLQADHLLVSPEGQTSNGHIMAIGGAAGVFESPHALWQLGIVLQRASGQAVAPLNPLRVPHIVQTTPVLAQIGLSQAGAPLRPGQLVLRASASETEAARAAGSLEGSAKLIVAGNGTILGGAVLGSGAGDMLAMLAMALDRGLSAADLAGLLLPPASPAAPLVDLGRQFTARHRPSPWAKRRAALRRLLP